MIRQRLLEAFLVIYIKHTLVNASDNVTCKPAPLEARAFEQCGRKGYALQCNGTKLTAVPSSFPPPTGDLKPPLCVLYLNDNDIQTIENNSFINVSDVQYLYLSHNNLSYIHPNAFANLSQLKYLNLSTNKLSWPESFGKGMFAPLVNLTHINVKQNQIYTYEGMDKEMEHLDLQGIYIDGCQNCSFGPRFANFPRLENVSLSGRRANDCVLTNVTRETFKNIPQVSRLWMSNCHIKNITPSSFEALEHLTLLDISYNEHLLFKGMNDALHGLQNHTSLEVLDVTRIHSLYDIGTKLEVSDITYISSLHNLKRLHLDLNKIEVLAEKILSPKLLLPKTLRVLTLSANRLTIGNYLNYLNKVTNITDLDISRQHLVYDPFVSCHFDPDSCPSKSNYKLTELNCSAKHKFLKCPPDVEKIKWRKSFLYARTIPDLCLIGGEHLQYLDLSFNLLLQWTGEVIGMPNLSHLDLSDNMCTNMTYFFFHQFPKLTYLNVSRNILSHSLNPNLTNNTDRYFEKLSKLRTLDLSSNRITSLHNNIFQKLSSLENVFLSKNELKEEDIELNIADIRCLKFLDLSSNKLKSLPKRLTKDLDSMTRRNCNITISVIDNPIDCTCRTLEFLKWMLGGPVNVQVERSTYCYLEDGTQKILNNETANGVIEDLEKKCRDFTGLMILCVSVSTVIITALFCAIVHRYRWKLRYLYYNRHRRHAREGFERLFENDAFVSYASTMCSFVKNQLVPNVEGEHKLRLWVADRNSQVGASMTENIVHAIINSRKSILLIDNAFLKDSMCDYEMNMARMESVESKRSLIIFVLFDGVSLTDLPPSIFKSCTNEECFKFPNQCDPDVLDEFWSTLAVAVSD